jgi:iron(III) transport system permease protein
MLPAIAIAWALVFVRVLGDLEVSALLAGTSNPTIGYQTMILYSQGSYSDVASLALVILVSSAVVVALVLALSRRLSRWNVVKSASAIGDY